MEIEYNSLDTIITTATAHHLDEIRSIAKKHILQLLLKENFSGDIYWCGKNKMN